MFYHEEEGRLIWEANGDFAASDVHKQVAISFRTPRYRVTDVSDNSPVLLFSLLKIILYFRWRSPSAYMFNCVDPVMGRAARRVASNTCLWIQVALMPL